MPATTLFTDTAAAEAWDTWFRWRERDGLRDRTIDSTWSRVANTIAAAEGAKAPLWAYRFVDAFSHWRLLPDERMLRLAGTGAVVNGPAPPSAALNLAAFVVAPLSTSARIDCERLADIAALAVRMLDDALGVWPDIGAAGQPELHIGVLGMADALHSLNIPYDTPQARQLAQEMAIAVASGTLRGSIELACERGAIDSNPDDLAVRWRNRGMTATLIADAARWGIRHTRLTSIEPQPRLALLANNVSDALDPMRRAPARSDGRLPTSATDREERADTAPSLLAQVSLRAAMQPWIDAPIEYLFSADAEPQQDELDAAAQLANERGLPPPRVRRNELATPISIDRCGDP